MSIDFTQKSKKIGEQTKMFARRAVVQVYNIRRNLSTLCLCI
jgi:hypothetical protein